MVVEKYEPIRLATPLLVSKMHAYTNTNNCFEFCKNVLMSEQVHPMFSFVLILYLFLAFAIYWKLIMIVLSKRCNSSPPPGGRGLFYFFVGYYWLLRMPLVTLFPIERMWSRRDAISTGNITLTALPRLQYFRCLLNRRGVQAAPVTNKYARRPPTGAGSCYEQ